MFQVPRPAPVRRCSGETALRIIDDIVRELLDQGVPELVAATGVQKVANHLGWTTGELLQLWPTR